ncbi:MAG TPA: hypothetical protein VEP89_02165 [Draconibacterium sp.]|nr:hypothetical protein [Draconibacterium sp.]
MCWDWVAGYDNTGWEKDKSKKTYKGNLSEKIISKCATVDEAINMFLKYNDDSFAYARIMIADKLGNSAIIGWENGKMFIRRNRNKLQAFGFKGDAVKSYFSENSKNTDVNKLAEALEMAHQEGKYPTQYSNIISISEGKIYLYRKHNYSEYLEINYLDKLNNSYSSYKMSELFDRKKSFSDMVLKTNN